MKTKNKPYSSINQEELAAATREIDDPLVIDSSRPLTPAERKRWKKLTRKRGRPKVGLGFKRISVSSEGGLLQRVTALARQRRVNRSKLFALIFEEALARDVAGR